MLTRSVRRYPAQRVACRHVGGARIELENGFRVHSSRGCEKIAASDTLQRTIDVLICPASHGAGRFSAPSAPDASHASVLRQIAMNPAVRFVFLIALCGCVVMCRAGAATAAPPSTGPATEKR